MRNKEMRRLPLNLQFFAEGDGAGADGGDGSGAGTGGEQNQTFDEILAAGHQAEFDRRMNKAIETAVKNAQDKWKLMTDDKVSEAEKLAKMTAQEREKYQQKKREAELDERERVLVTKELKATAMKTLAEKSLPLGLAEVLNYADAESCNASITAVEKAFQDAVENAVNERLKGGETIKKTEGGLQAYTKEQVSAMSTDEINKNWAAISESMKNWK